MIILVSAFAACISLLAWLQNRTTLHLPAWLYLALISSITLAALGLGYRLCRRAALHTRPWIGLSVLAAGILGLAVALPALAAYTGPNRTTTSTVYERKECYYTADTTVAGRHWGCHLYLYTTPNGACPSASSTADLFNPGPCGWPAGISCTTPGISCTLRGPAESMVDCSPGQQGCTGVPHTTNLPPATVSGTAVCDQPGDNGWCIGGSRLELTAGEPVSGWTITGIESDPWGMLCGGNGTASLACTWSFPEGQTSLDFWSLSSHGDTSQASSVSMGLDTGKPSLAISMPLPDGQNGWFVSAPVTVSVAASDAVSGVGAAGVSLDGTSWSPSLSLAADGAYTVYASAVDNAGNLADTLTGTLRIDTTSPALTVDQPPATGTGGWYITSPVQVSAAAVDAASGLAPGGLLYAIDGDPLQPGNLATVTGDGTHTVTFQAVDQAGNTAAETRTLNVDTAAAQLSLSGRTSFCRDCGEHLALAYSVQDGGSGVAAWSLSADSTILVSGSGAVSGTFDWKGDNFTLGLHTLTLEARDLAGNLVQAALQISLDGVPQPEATASGRIFHPLPPTPGPASTAAPQSPFPAAPTIPPDVAAIVPPANPAGPTSASGGNGSGTSPSNTDGSTPGLTKSGSKGDSSTSSQPWQSLPPGVPIGATTAAVAVVSGIAAYALGKKKEPGPVTPAVVDSTVPSPGSLVLLKVTQAIVKNYNALIGLNTTLQRVMLPPVSDFRFEELCRNARNYTPDEFEAALFEIQNNPQMNWSDVADLLKRRIPSTIESGLSAVGLLESLAGESLQGSNPDLANVLIAHGQVTTGAVNIENATRLFVRLAESPTARAGGELIQGPLGKVLVPLQVILGGWTYYEDMRRLWTDPTLDPRVSGESAWVPRIGVALEGLGGGLVAVSGLMALTGVLTPVAAVLFPIGLALGGIGVIMKNWDTISNAFTNGINAWKGNFQQLGVITRILSERAAHAIATGAPAAGNALGDAITRVSTAAANATRAVSTAVANTASAIGNAAANATRAVSTAVANTARAAGNAVANATQTVSTAVSNAVGNASTSVANAINNFGSSFGSPVARQVASSVANTVRTVGNAVSNTVQRIGNTVANVQRSLGNAVGNAVQRVGNAVANVQRSVGNAVGNAVQRVGNAVANVQQSVGNAVSTGVRNVLNGIGNLFGRRP